MDFKSRSLRLAVIVTLAGISLATLGCDKQERQAAWKAQREADAARPTGADAITIVKAKLSSVANDKGTGESVLAHATIADAEVLAASEPAMAFRRALDRSRKLAATIEDRATSAQRLLNAVASINNRDPAESLESIASFTAAEKGEGNANTFALPGDNTLPSLNALDQNISKFTTSIADFEAQIASLSDERAKLLDKADKADRKAGTVERDERVKAVTQAANARNDAAKKSSQIDQLKSQLLHLRADLATHEAQRAAIQAGIASLDEQSTGLGAAWAEMSQHASGLTAKANELLSSGDGSVTSLANALVTEIAEADRTLKEADEHFALAIKSYNDAAAVAATMAGNFGNVPPEDNQRASFKTLVEALPRAKFDLYSAWTSMTRAQLHADYATALADRKEIAIALANAAQASGYKVPDVLDVNTIDKSMRAEITTADSYFQEAHNKLEDVAGSTRMASLKKAAIGGRIFNNYYRAMLSKLAAKVGGFDEIAAGEANYMKAAQAALAEATEANLPTPVLPASLRTPIEKPTEGETSTATTQATGSTTEPSTQPETTVSPLVAQPTSGEIVGDRVNFGTFSVALIEPWTLVGVNEMQPLVEFPGAHPFASLVRNWKANIGDGIFTIAVLNTPVEYEGIENAVKQYAKASNSELLEKLIDVGGQTGYRLKGADLRTQNPTAGIFVMYKKTAYIIAGGRVNGDDAWPDLEAIAASWEWIDTSPHRSGEGSFE